jgi:hypothetical protein
MSFRTEIFCYFKDDQFRCFGDNPSLYVKITEMESVLNEIKWGLTVDAFTQDFYESLLSIKEPFALCLYSRDGIVQDVFPFIKSAVSFNCACRQLADKVNWGFRPS